VISVEQQSRSVNKPHSRAGGNLLARAMRELLRVPLVFCLAHTMISGAVAGQGDSAGEYELKAAMLYNLTLFVEWPPSAYPDQQAPILLCILGRDPFGSSLISIVPKQTVDGRLVLIRHPQNEKEIRGCHVLYISSSERKTTVQIFSTLKGSSVLTVGEMTQFAERGGMIQFALENQQVRFDINLDAASRAGLKISSRLLVLAHIVGHSPLGKQGEGQAASQFFGGPSCLRVNKAQVVGAEVMSELKLRPPRQLGRE
jgi:YfiR/HmsC-like